MTVAGMEYLIMIFWEFYDVNRLWHLICSRLLSTSKPVGAILCIIDTRNNLPKEIAEANNLNVFKNRLKYYLMSVRREHEVIYFNI